MKTTRSNSSALLVSCTQGTRVIATTAKEDTDKLRVEGHVDPRVEATVQSKQPKEPVQAAYCERELPPLHSEVYPLKIKSYVFVVPVFPILHKATLRGMVPSRLDIPQRLLL